MHEKKIKVLQDRLSQYFQQTYPQFEYELKYFSYDNEKFIDSMVNAYSEQLVVHHHHYFPDMDHIGVAHNFCNVVTYTKGQPPAHIYVHNLTNFDSSFILKMIPPDVMAHKGKNTEKQWSVICPPGNKNKMKLLMTPFGTFSDYMNFFQASLAKMAKEMNSNDIEELYELHVRYFKTNTQFKVVLKNREREGKPFTLDRFKSMFRGKLFFPYDSFGDIDWLYCKSETLPEIEAFCENKMGTEWPTAQEYLNMVEIYKYFECSTMSDLLHIYTLEDGMLLALIMSNTFVTMYNTLGLDPTNFASTAKFSYTACKRITGMTMQTIPNRSVFNCIGEMKRASFSMVK